MATIRRRQKGQGGGQTPFLQAGETCRCQTRSRRSDLPATGRFGRLRFAKLPEVRAKNQIYRPHGTETILARRFVVARRFIPDEEPQSTLFTLGRYMYRAWVTNMDLTPSGIWHYYDGRAGMEPRICELREEYALRKIPTASFAANALYLEIVRLAYNLVTAFQRTCLEESWQSLTLQKLRYKLFLLPGELTRPQNRPVLRLRQSPLLQDLANGILRKVNRLTPIHA